MKQPKLLLPWSNSFPSAAQPTQIIDSVLRAWTYSRVHETVVVVRRDDCELAAACTRWPVHVVHPEHEPADMKASIMEGLTYIATQFEPANEDYILVAPSDLPTLRCELIDQLIVATQGVSEGVIAPTFGGKQGHPVVLSWEVAAEIYELEPTEGLDRILQRSELHTVAFPPEWNARDVDTPEEYLRAIRDLKDND